MNKQIFSPAVLCIIMYKIGRRNKCENNRNGKTGALISAINLVKCPRINDLRF